MYIFDFLCLDYNFKLNTEHELIDFLLAKQYLLDNIYYINLKLWKALMRQ
jgi:hypothetical protein